MSEWGIVDRIPGTMAQAFLDNAYLVTGCYFAATLPPCCERHCQLAAGNNEPRSGALNYQEQRTGVLK